MNYTNGNIWGQSSTFSNSSKESGKESGWKLEFRKITLDYSLLIIGSEVGI